VNLLPVESFQALPRSYLRETELPEETGLTIELLNALAALASRTELPDKRALIQERASWFAAMVRERSISTFCAFDCAPLRAALAKLTVHSGSSNVIPLGGESSTPTINVVHAVQPALRGHIELVRQYTHCRAQFSTHNKFHRDY
jgi:hypothetical protein